MKRDKLVGYGWVFVCISLLIFCVPKLVRFAELNIKFVKLTGLVIDSTIYQIGAGECNQLQSAFDRLSQYSVSAYRGLIMTWRCSASPPAFLEKWESALVRQPGDSLTAFYLGNLYDLVGLRQQAVEYWRMAGAEPFFALSGYALLKKGDLIESLEQADLSDMINSNAAAAQLYIDLTLAFFEGQDLSHALQACESAKRIAAWNPWAYYVCGLVYSGQALFPQAVASFKRSIELGGVGMWAWHHLGRTYYYMGEFDLAKQALYNGMAISPRDEASYRWLGLIYTQEKDYENAIQNLRIAIDLSPDNRQSWVYLLQVYKEIGDDSALQQVALEMLVRFPCAVEPVIHLATILKKQERCSDAENIFELVFIPESKSQDLPEHVCAAVQQELTRCGVSQ